ncbi:putative NmrA-like family domain-containing protein 1 [Amylocarpus encephaloides]|uniref:NmrA-like family domain-containing protein 1 n=1 Tax=Amylocarpus encephaloides TaxID=45428 RepID=A0A9P8C7F8_9HELO|nr:putative NmrA-like family domain-containing protein 1 [Amylocarpus encephaloides]
MTTQTILVIGATGTQGGSVIKALLANPALPPTTQIVALSRNPSSTKSKSLLTLDSRISLLQGDASSPEQIFSSANTHITSVFLVTVHGAPGVEESQANALIDAALKHGVQHFVFTSADRGGEVASDRNPTPVPHIATKFHIEQHLKTVTAGSDMKWTILRPVTFMDNLTPDFAGKGFAAMWRQVGARKIQLVAASDIGLFAAKALLHPGEYEGRSIGIAGDELSYEDAERVFEDVLGVKMPTTFCAVGSVLKVAMGDIGAMFKWFETAGFAVDMQAARREVPEMMDFGTWLKRSSGFRDLKK